MKKFRWQLMIIFLTGMVIGFLLLGERPTPTALVGATPEPVEGGVYTEALIGSFQRLNPLLDFYNPVDRDINRLLFSSLVKFDSNGFPRPDLAEVWGISQDGTLYNFSLRNGVKWHDGRPLTTEDIMFTVDLMRNGGKVVPKNMQEFWNTIEVKKFNDQTMQFRLPEAFSPFLDYLTFGVLPKHLLDGVSADALVDSPYNLKPIGSGPYRFEQLIVENNRIAGVALAAFEGYYAAKPFIQDVVFRYYPDSATALNAYKDGLVQGVSQVTQDSLSAALALPNLALYSARMPQQAIILFNLKDNESPFFQDAKVRKALLVGLNRQWLIDRLLGGQAILSDGPVFPGTWAYFGATELIRFDIEQANNLLREAGYVYATDKESVRSKDKVELGFKLLHQDDELHRNIAESIQKDWSKIGVSVDLEALPLQEILSERLEPRLYQAVLINLNFTRSPDPDPYPFWDQGQATGGQNFSQWDHRLASEYIQTARVTLDISERARFYRNFQVIFRQEWPALPLYYPVYTYAIDRQVQGVRIGPLFDSSDRFANLNEWYLATQIPKEAALPKDPQKTP